MAFRRKDDHKYRASETDTRLTRFRPKYKASHDKASERELPEICRYCVNAHKLFDSETMLCEKKGVVSCRYTCRRFVYDPLKHVPFQAPTVFDEDMVMPTLDDISLSDELQTPQERAGQPSESGTDTESGKATVKDTAADTAYLPDNGDIAGEEKTAAFADSYPADRYSGETSADNSTSDKPVDHTAGGKGIDDGIPSDIGAGDGTYLPGSTDSEKNETAEHVTSQFGMESLWCDTSK